MLNSAVSAVCLVNFHSVLLQF